MIHTTKVGQAQIRLAKLRKIEAELCAHIIELQDDTSYLASSMSQSAANRLRHEIRPAIKECLDLIRKHA